VCASAGNHGQGVAYACHLLGIRGRVYLPANTPRQKRQRIAAIGGQWIEPIIAGSSYAHERERELAALCDPTLRERLVADEIELITFRELAA
jgi:threonine dehydratase